MSTSDAEVPPLLLERLLRVYDPVRVWLFGSRARGDARVGSDWDLVVVLPDDVGPASLDPIAARRAIRDLALPVDLVLVTESDFREGASHFGTLAQIVVDEGRMVYAGLPTAPVRRLRAGFGRKVAGGVGRRRTSAEAPCMRRQRAPRPPTAPVRRLRAASGEGR